MADDSDSFDWGEFAEAVTEAAISIAVTVAVNEAMAAITGTKDKAGAQSSQISIQQPIPPQRRLVGGYSCFAPAYAFKESKGNCIGAVYAVANQRLDSIERWLLNEDVVTLGGDGRVISVNGSGDGPYMDDPDPRVVIHYRMGLPTETAYEPITSRWSQWTSAHRGDGVASAMMCLFAPRAKFLKEAFPYGPPNLRLATRAVFYDWRDDDQDREDEATWGPCDNPVVLFVHKEWTEYGRDWETSIAPVLSALTDDADYCDEAVDLAAGGTEKRYRCAFSHLATEAEDSVRAKILATMDGRWTEDANGCLIVKAGRYETPTITLTPADITAVSWREATPTEIGADRLNVSFISPAANYAQADCDAWIINELGDRAQDFFVEGSPSFSQTRRLAKRRAQRIAAAGAGRFTVNTDVVWGQRYVAISYPGVPELDGIVIEIDEDGVSMDEIDGFSFGAVQISAAIDAWNPETEEGADPGATSRPAYEPLSPPTIEDAVAIYDALGARISIDAVGPLRSDLTWSYRWRIDGDGIWYEFTDSSITGGWVTLTTGVVPLDADIEVSAGFRTGGGVWSGWSDEVDEVIVVTSSGNIAPAAPTEFDADPGAAGEIVASWRNPYSLNVAGVRVWRAATGTPFDPDDYTDISGLMAAGVGVADGDTFTGVTAGAYDIYVTAENSAGTLSPETGPITVTVT